MHTREAGSSGSGLPGTVENDVSWPAEAPVSSSRGRDARRDREIDDRSGREPAMIADEAQDPALTRLAISSLRTPSDERRVGGQEKREQMRSRWAACVAWVCAPEARRRSKAARRVCGSQPARPPVASRAATAVVTMFDGSARPHGECITSSSLARRDPVHSSQAPRLFASPQAQGCFCSRSLGAALSCR